MSSTTNVKLTVAFVDLDLDDDERDAEVQKLLVQMRELDEVEAVERTYDPKPPAGNKALGGFLVGLLTAEVSSENVKKLFSFLSDRLSNRSIELEVEANGRKLKVKASNREELAVAIEAAQKFITG